MSQDVFIHASNIKKYYVMGKGKRKEQVLKAVDDISISIKKGEIMGVVGESGSGKSTLGRCILNLIPIDDGQVVFNHKRIDGRIKTNFKPYRRKMQMIFQNPLASFDPKQPIGSAFKELAKVYKIPYREMNHRLVQILDMINLTVDVLNRMPNLLSGGQLQRLAIARALLLKPEFIVADEPVSALDVSVQAQILNLLLDIRDEMGLSIMFISHDLNVVEKVCDTIAVLYLGVLVEVAPKDDLFRKTAHPYTKGLMEAKPKDHPLEKRERELLKGEVTNAIDHTVGCRFAGRCTYATEKCYREEPKLESIDEAHFVACFNPLTQ